MTIDHEAVRFWISVLQFLGTIAIGVYVWWSNREKVTAKRFAALEREVAKRATDSDLKQAAKEAADKIAVVNANLTKHQTERCGQHLNRTAALEVTVKGAPTHDDLGKVYELINKVGGAVESLKGTMGGINNNVNLLVEHHLKGGKS